MKKLLISLLVILIINACSSVDKKELGLDNNDIQNIIELQDKKDVKSLIGYFVNPSNELQARACMAFASIKDSSALSSLYTMLEEDENVAQAAAFAIGQTGSSSSIPPLKKVLERSMNEETRYQIFAAIGKCGDINENYFLASNYNVGKDARGTAWALFYLSRNEMINEAGIELAVKIIENEKDPRTRLGAAQAIARSVLEKPWKSLLPLYKIEQDDDVQMALASGLRGLAIDSLNSSLIEFLRSNSNNTQINFIKAVHNLDSSLLVEYCTSNISLNKNINLQIASAEYLANYPDEVLVFIASIPLDSLNWRVRTTLLAPILTLQNDEFINYARAQYMQSENLYERGELLRLLATVTDQKELLKKEILSHDSIIGTYGISAFAGLMEDESKKEKENEYPFLEACLASNSSAIVTYAALLLRDSVFIDDSYIQKLRSVRDSIQLPEMAEAHIELSATIAYLEGSEDEKADPISDHAINKEMLSELQNVEGFKVLTSKGEIFMQVEALEAPGTVQNLVELINSGYYDGKLFHRVVPNFVIQTGCPNGDGWGGLDYTMRSEFTALEYSTGAVGMASAGQDTESCQWFITHSPTPHLNGRYTLFAYVTSGMDVVENMEVGDQILKMTVQYRNNQ